MASPTTANKTKAAFYTAGAAFSGWLGDKSTQRSAESSAALTTLKSTMKQLQENQTLSLRQKKTDFLKAANTQICKLTTTDLLELYTKYTEDITKKTNKYLFIYQEDTTKPIGWIKHTLFRCEQPTGNTDTHKIFLGLLKKRALANFERHNNDPNRRMNQQQLNEQAKLAPLLLETRGRLPNVTAHAGFGLEGEFRSWRAT